MAYSIQREVSDGTLQTLTLRISYFKKTHIFVYVDDKIADGSTGRYSWVWDGERIRLNKVVPAGIEVMIRRKTPMDTPFHNFRQGAVFKDVTMDENFIQQLYINQENVEGLSATDFYSDLDLHNYRMKNVGTAINDADAVSLGQYRADALGANQYRILAEASKVAAKASEVASAASAQIALTASSASESSAISSANSAISVGQAEARTLEYRNQAESARVDASNSKQAAGLSAASASNSAAEAARVVVDVATTAANVIKGVVRADAESAAASAASSSSSAGRASSEADRAKVEADRAADAAGVSYLPAGTGAVATDVQSHLRYLDIKTLRVDDYMTPKDRTANYLAPGSVDVGYAILAALAGALPNTQKSKLVFGSGIYKTSVAIDVNTPGLMVVGEGRYNTVIKYTGAGIAVKFTNANPNNGSYAFGGSIEDICIEGNANSTSLLYIKYVNHFLARNVNLRESSATVGVGLHVLGTVLGYFENVYCSSNAQLMTNRPYVGLVVDRDPTTLARATANTFVHCVFEGMNGDGIQLINSDQSTFFGGTSENNIGNGVTISAGSRMNTFVSVAFENGLPSTFADIYDNGFSNRFINCYSKKLIYIDTAAQFAKVEGGFHQSITVAGDFATLQDLKYSFFAGGGAIATTANTSTRNLFNVNTSRITFAIKPTANVSVTASPFTYTNGSGLNESVIVSGGTVSEIVFDRGGTVVTVPVAGMYQLAPTDKLTISYTSAPKVVRVPAGTNYI